MKKILFLFGMLLASGFCFAQSNIANVNQSNDSQTATINQDGFRNRSYTNQSNLLNVAEVTQENHNTKSYTDGDGNVFYFDNLAETNQSGQRNEAVIDQVADGTVAQSNTIGTLHAIVNQSGNDNKSLQVQGPNGQQGISYAEIGQSGNRNFASQHQLRYANTARLFQSGSDNTGMQAQDATILEEEEGSANNAYLEQSGNGNTATQDQDGWSNTATAYQSGNNNSLVQLQRDYSWMSIAYANQSGSWNQATQDQMGLLNYGKIEQASDVNKATQTQLVTGVRRPGIDYTPYNKAEIYQWGGNYNEAIQEQTSPGNNLIMNEAIIWQNGAANFASQVQNGADNHSAISQAGNWNHADIIQNNP